MSSTPRRPQRPSKTTRTIAAAAITGSLALAGVATASAASAASVTSGSASRTVAPALKADLDLVLKPPFPDGCIVCGLGGFDPIFESLAGGL